MFGSLFKRQCLPFKGGHNLVIVATPCSTGRPLSPVMWTASGTGLGRFGGPSVCRRGGVSAGTRNLTTGLLSILLLSPTLTLMLDRRLRMVQMPFLDVRLSPILAALLANRAPYRGLGVISRILVGR